MVITADTALSEILNSQDVKSILDDTSNGINGIVSARVDCLENEIGTTFSNTSLNGVKVISDKANSVVGAYNTFTESMYSTFGSIEELSWNKELEELQELEKKIKEKIEELENEIKRKREAYDALSEEDKAKEFYSFASEVRELRQKIIDYEEKLLQVIARENGSSVVDNGSINTDINQDLSADEVAQFSQPSPLDSRNWAPSYMGGNQPTSPARVQAEQAAAASGTPADNANWAPSYMGGNQPASPASANFGVDPAAKDNGFSNGNPVQGGGGTTTSGSGAGRADLLGAGAVAGSAASGIGATSQAMPSSTTAPPSTPSPTSTSTPSPTATASPTPTPTPTPTPSPTASPDNKSTVTPTPTATTTPTDKSDSAGSGDASSRDTVINSALDWGKGIADDESHGYSQGSRWGPDYDCSSFAISAYDQAGIPVKANGANSTRDMKEAFEKSGFEWIEGNPIKNGTELQPGDVVLDIGHHAEIYYGDGKTIGAHYDYNGKTGDKYDKEINLKDISTSRSWDGVLRLKT